MSVRTSSFQDLKAVAFDAGNTLLGMDFDFLASCLLTCGVEISAERLERAEAQARPEVSAWIASGRSTESSQTFGFYLDAIVAKVSDLSPDARGRCIGSLVPLLKPPGLPQRLWTRPYPRIATALSRFHEAGFQLAVVSNSDGSITEALRSARLDGFFSSIIDSAEVGVEKPAREIFEHALGVLGLPPEQVLYVGDLYAVDIIGARSAGMPAVLVDPFGDWADLDCETVKDIDELATRLIDAR